MPVGVVPFPLSRSPYRRGHAWGELGVTVTGGYLVEARELGNVGDEGPTDMWLFSWGRVQTGGLLTFGRWTKKSLRCADAEGTTSQFIDKFHHGITEDHLSSGLLKSPVDTHLLLSKVT